MSQVICKLPKAGLGNQLFPLMHAVVFAQINNLPLIVIGYHQLKIGPYLRREKSKRKYKGFFKFEKNIFFAFIDEIKVNNILKNSQVVYEHSLIEIDPIEKEKKVFFFEKMPIGHNYFIHLKPHRNLVIKLLNELISEEHLKKSIAIPHSEIGVHIRMGDFRKLDVGEEFKGGPVRTPEIYFIDIINGIRNLIGNEIKVNVFTNGYKNEFETIFNLKNIEMVEGNNDLVDMLLLSKSKIIVISTGSTFSYWAAFLSNAPIIMHPDHIHARIRDLDKKDNIFEGCYEDAIGWLKLMNDEKRNS
jgi:hypothetical protein